MKKPLAPPPVVTTPEQLPLDNANFSWEQFEAFCRHFIECLPGVVNCFHYGKRGNKQRGIDMVAELSNGEKWVFQCKQYKRFSAEQTEKAIQTLDYKADRCILLLACEATVEVRDEIAKHSDWSVWDVRDISHKVRTLKEYVAARLVKNHFGPAWSKAFLGREAAGESLITAEEFFAPLLNPKNLFNHSWTLAGRRDYVEELLRFGSSGDEQIAVLIGRGGIGKSKILHAFALEFEKSNPGTELRFMVEGLPVSTESLEEVSNQPCVIVVDDAHRREDLTQLLSFARRKSLPAPKIILAVRPSSAERLFSTLAQTGFDGREILRLAEVKQLGRDDVKAIAGQALGDANSPDIPALVAVTYDSPLITLIGGRLLAEKNLDVRLLERHDEFRQAVLTRFQEMLIGNVAADRVSPEECRDVLSLISGISPYRLDNSNFLETAAKFLNIAPERLIQILDVLEEAGALLRRGYSLRITPDVLADHLLHKASVANDGRPTGFAEKLFEAFIPVCPSQVLKNLAELDWRIGRSAGDETALLENIWKALRSDFARGNNELRCFILDMLKEATHYQPAQALELLEFAMRHPYHAPPAEEGEEFGGLYAPTHGSVLRRLPPLLQRIGYTLDYLPRCCDLLWELGRDDGRQTGPHPEHAVRVLEDFAAYDLQKPVRVNKIVVEAAERWLKSADAHEHLHSPFEVLNKVLQKNGHSSYSEGLRFVTRPFSVNPDSTGEIRETAFRLITEGATSTDLKIALRAVNSLKIALSSPVPYFDMIIKQEEFERWEPVQSKVLDLFAEVVQKNTHPLVHLQIIEAVGWHARHNKLESIRLKAREVLSLIPATHELRLVRILSNTYDWNLEDEDFDKRQKRVNDERQATAEEFLAQYKNAEAGVNRLNELLGEIVAATGKYSDPWLFLYALALADAEYAAQMCEFIVQHPDSLLAVNLGTLLPFVNRNDSARAEKIVARIVESENTVLYQALAAAVAFWCERWAAAAGVSADDLQTIGKLIGMNDRAVKQLVIRLLPVMWRAGYKKAADLLESFGAPLDFGLLIEACGIFNEYETGIPEDEITGEQLQFLLENFAEVPSLDDYHLGKFIAFAAKKSPRETVQMLLRRVEQSDRVTSGYEPLPPLGIQHKLEGLNLAPDYADLLRSVRDRILATGNTLESFTYLPELFSAVTVNFSPPALEVLNEWVESGEAEKVEAASRLLKEADKHFVFEESVFTENLLEKAYAAGDDCYAHVADNLHCQAVSGEREGVPGEPFPQEIALRDKARAAALKYNAGSPVRRFFDRLLNDVESSIKHQLLRDEELV